MFGFQVFSLFFMFVDRIVLRVVLIVMKSILKVSLVTGHKGLDFRKDLGL